MPQAIIRYIVVDEKVHLVKLSAKTARPQSKTLCGKSIPEGAERSAPTKKVCRPVPLSDERRAEIAGRCAEAKRGPPLAKKLAEDVEMALEEFEHARAKREQSYNASQRDAKRRSDAEMALRNSRSALHDALQQLDAALEG